MAAVGAVGGSRVGGYSHFWVLGLRGPTKGGAAPGSGEGTCPGSPWSRSSAATASRRSGSGAATVQFWFPAGGTGISLNAWLGARGAAAAVVVVAVVVVMLMGDGDEEEKKKS